MKRPLRIVLSGAGGRMGRAVAAAAQADPRFCVIGGVGRGPAPGLGFPSGGPSALRDFLGEADVLVDFSLPAPALQAAAAAAKARVPVVSGTTALDAGQMRRLRGLARRIPVFWAPNMSPGMNLLFELAHRAAAALPGYGAAVIDVHHGAKKDAPSGSAKRLAESLRAGGASPETVSLRVGDVAGDHTVVLAGPGERLELVHRAHSREVFARGALSAAIWTAGRRPGFYGMRNLLDR
ncbi:MAG: 4-hydroxy-tetrahydrodipicolinate reductase [Elusimicrobia bacterium]|nr:4-hydroxy-tetrahydrodipicolinate reductase [Elusimicrobiota bacterium]